MSIQSNLAAPGLVRRKPSFAGSDVAIQWSGIPFIVKVAMVLLSCLTLIIFSVLSVSRTDVVPEIKTVDSLYLPGNTIVDASGECFEHDFIYRSCAINISGQKIYFTFDRNTHMIIRTSIHADAYRIGDLIRAWGYPGGYRHQLHAPIMLYWGNRAAIVYDQSFRPESRVAFIEYELDSPSVPVWQGFKLFNK